MLIKRPDLARRSGASERMIDYWTRSGVISCEEREHEGSGHTRYYDEELIPMLTVFVRISKALGKSAGAGGAPSSVLKAVRDNFMEGYANIGNDIFISWRHNA